MVHIDVNEYGSGLPIDPKLVYVEKSTTKLQAGIFERTT